MAHFANQTSREEASRECTVDSISHEAALIGTALVGAVDGDTTAHVAERDTISTVSSHHAAGMGISGIDGAGGMKVLDSGTIGVAERATEFLSERLISGTNIDSQRMTVAIESASERVVGVYTRHSRNTDVGGQFHRLIDIAVHFIIIVLDLCAESIPVVRAGDEVDAVSVGRKVSECSCGIDGNVVFGHDKRIRVLRT